MPINKVAIIGAGAVGFTLAQRIAESGMADIVMVDIAKSPALGKAYDLEDAGAILGHEHVIEATDDYSMIRGSDIVVITAGFPRKPGMTREELIAKNAAIVKTAAGAVKAHASQSIVIVVTNPLDAMTYLAYKTSLLSRKKVFGMAGVLDSSRFINLVAKELKVSRATIKALILGSHGDTMVPVLSQSYVGNKLIANLVKKDRLEAIIQRTRDRGAELVSLLGSGSAYFSPSAAVYKMIETIAKDAKSEMVVSANLEGEYGLKDLAIGVPCIIGKNGIERIVEIGLTADEKEALRKSAEAIRSTIKLL